MISQIVKLGFVSAPPVCTQSVDICLVIDSSGSIQDANPPDKSFDNWLLLLNFVAGLVDFFEVGPDPTHTRIGAVVFSNDARLVFPMNRYTTREQLKNALRSIQFLGQETNTPEALRVTREQCLNPRFGERPNVQNIVIIITDGVPHPPSRRGPAIAEAQRLQSVANMFSIGITNTIDRNLLRSLSSAPRQENVNYFMSMGFTALNEITRIVGLGTCPDTPGPLTGESAANELSHLTTVLTCGLQSAMVQTKLSMPQLLLVQSVQWWRTSSLWWTRPSRCSAPPSSTSSSRSSAGSVWASARRGSHSSASGRAPGCTSDSDRKLTNKPSSTR